MKAHIDTINLTTDGTHFLRISSLSEELIKHVGDTYGEMDKIDLKTRSDEVIVWNKTERLYKGKKIFRTYKSYMNTPKFEGNTSKSHMFSGDPKSHMFSGDPKSHMFSGDPKSHMFSGKVNDQDFNNNLPEMFKPIQQYVESLFASEYNQSVVNWYGDESYIEMHSDCTSKMVNNASIVIVNLNCPDSLYNRLFKLKAKEVSDETLIAELDISLTQGLIIEMGGNTQSVFRHGVGQSESGRSGRISVTFRQMKT